MLPQTLYITNMIYVKLTTGDPLYYILKSANFFLYILKNTDGTKNTANLTIIHSLTRLPFFLSLVKLMRLKIWLVVLLLYPLC